MPDLLVRSRELRAPILTTIHSTIRSQREGSRESRMPFADLDLSEKATLLLYPLLSFLEYRYFCGDRAYVTVSRWSVKQVSEWYPQLLKRRIVAIHNAVDPSFWKPQPREAHASQDVVLFVGRMIGLKGIGFLVDAIPDILRDHKRTLFLFVGPGDPRPYQERLSRLGVAKQNFQFLGYQNRDQLKSIYNEADVLVLPSLTENLPATLLEAMSSGIAVVATRVGGIPEVVTDGADGLMVEPGSGRDVAEKVIFLLDNPEVRRKLGEQARRKVIENFSWSLAAEKYSELYSSLLLGKSPSAHASIEG